MAHRIKNNPLIRGIKIGKTETSHVITQFADNTGLFLMYNETVLETTISELMYIEKNTGLKVSYDKTCVYRLGSLRNSNAKIYTKKELQWFDGDIEILGITVWNASCQNNKQIDTIISKMQAVAVTWSNRNLTLMGKITIINTFMNSLFVYCMFVLPVIDAHQHRKAEEIILNFLWGKKKAKIPLTVLYKLKYDGGLQLSNLHHRHIAFRTQWVKLIYDLPEWGYIHEWLIPEIGKDVWSCNLKIDDVDSMCKCRNGSWVEVLQLWSKFHFSEPQTRREIREQVIWYNSILRVGNNVICYRKDLYEKIQTVSDIVDDEGNIVEWNTVCMNYNIANNTCNWLWYTGLCSAIPTMWKIILKDTNSDGMIGSRNVKLTELLTSKKTGRLLYTWLNRKIPSNKIVQYAQNWFEKLHMNGGYDNFLQLLHRNYAITNNIKLRNFQYRLFIGKIFTNDTLHKWGIVDSELCNLCGQHKQDNIHLSCKCETTKELWLKVCEICKLRSITDEEIMNNSIEAKIDHIYNFTALLCKQYIFRCKCLDEKPNSMEFFRKLKEQYKMEKYNNVISSNNKFTKRWKPVLNTLNLS